MELRPLKSQNRIKGALSITIGILFLVSLLFLDQRKMVIPTAVTDHIPARYFVLILIINCAIYLIVFGILRWIGRMNGGYEGNISEAEKAKQRLLSLLLSIPIWISLADLLFFVAENKVWKVLGGLTFTYLLWILVSSLRKIRLGT